jgi:hypothetical protein
MAAGSEAVTVGLGDLPDDAVGAKESELAAGLGGQTALVIGSDGRGVEEGADVAISEAGGGELA